MLIGSYANLLELIKLVQIIGKVACQTLILIYINRSIKTDYNDVFKDTLKKEGDNVSEQGASKAQ